MATAKQAAAAVWLGGPKMNRDNLRPTVVEVPKRPTTDKLVFSVEDINKEKALRYLETQIGETNRRVSDSRVSSFAAVMKRGEWQLNSQPIGFDEDGHLVDGQHRLWAIVTANVTVRVSVAYGLTDAAVKTLDRGRVRSIAESLRRDSVVPKSLRGETGRISAWATSEYKILMNSNRPGSVEETERYYESNREAVEHCLETLPKRGSLKAASIGAAIVIAMRRYPDEARQFLADIVDGSGLERTSPALVLRNHADRMVGNSKMMARPLGVKTLRAMQAYIDGETIPDGKLQATESAIIYFTSEPVAKKSRRA